MTALTYFLTKSSNKCNWPSFHLGIFIPILYILKYVNKPPIDHNIFNLSNQGCAKNRRIEQTNRTIAKFSVWFRFGSVSVSFFKNRNFRFRFRCWIFSHRNRSNIYIYIYSRNSSTELISCLMVCSLWFDQLIPGLNLRVGRVYFAI